MASIPCTDRTINSILAGWRYDISGLTPDMRKDYEQHLAECGYCSFRQRFHRRLDLGLAAVAALFFFFFAAFFLALLRHVGAVHRAALTTLNLVDASALFPLLPILALVGATLSILVFILVLSATPSPGYLGNLAVQHMKKIEERMPEAMRRPRAR